MYRESLSLFRSLSAWVVIYISVEMLLQIADVQSESPWILIAWILNWIFFNYVVFNKLLADRLEPSAKALNRLFGFALRLIALLLLIFIPALFAFFLSAVLFGASPDENVPQEILDAQFGFDYSIMLVTGSIASVFVLSLFGTCLPAYLERQRQGIVGTFRQGRQAFWHTTGLLVVGPTVVGALGEGFDMLALYVSVGKFISAEDLVAVVSEDWVPNIPVILLILIRDAFFAFSVAMTAWVLSKAYTNAVGNRQVVSVFE